MKQIHRYSMEGEFLRSYDSVVEAAQEFGVTASSIGLAASGRTQSSAGYRWSYTHTKRLLTTKQRYEKRFKPVIRTDIETGKIKEYISLQEAAEDVWSHRQNVSAAIKYKKPHLGYLWRWKNGENNTPE